MYKQIRRRLPIAKRVIDISIERNRNGSLTVSHISDISGLYLHVTYYDYSQREAVAEFLDHVDEHDGKIIVCQRLGVLGG